MLDTLVFPEWLLQGYLGDDEEGNPIVWDIDTMEILVGYDDEDTPIFVEVP